MDTITVQTEVTSFEQSKSQAITGVIFFDFVSYQFPEKGWNDFAIVVLNWWLSALKNIVLSVSDHEELRFMDGPLYIRVKMLNNGLCRLECIDESADGKVEFSNEYNFTDLLNSIIEAAKTTDHICSQNGWVVDDVRELRKLIEDLSN